MGPVMIMAGGTGGHIFPGLAVARALRERDVPVVWLGSVGGLEGRLVAGAGLPLESVAVSALRGKGALALLLAPLRLLRSVWQAMAVLRRHRPRCVLSMGGFVAGPGGIAAWLLGRPLLVHEQNRIAGLTNRLLGRLARRRLAGFPDVRGLAGRIEDVGNPVRAEIAALAPPGVRLAGRAGPLRLLVIGGSQGARALNRAVPALISQLGADAVEVRQQCGPRMLEEARAAHAAAGTSALVEPFIADMAAAYAWADLVLCRSGALTVAELAAAGAASVLVPFPAAVDDHQTANAEFLVAHGAALRLAEGDDFARRLAAAVAPLASDRARLLAMAEAAHALGRADAAERVADACLEEATP